LDAISAKQVSSIAPDWGMRMLRRIADEIAEGEARRTNALMGLIVILLLAIAGVLLVRELREEGQIEDCVIAGRHNCFPIQVPIRYRH